MFFGAGSLVLRDYGCILCIDEPCMGTSIVYGVGRTAGLAVVRGMSYFTVIGAMNECSGLLRT